MSDQTIESGLFHKLRYTPLSDLFRCRLTARLDWKAIILAAELPPASKAMIDRLIRRTRLWRSERVDVTRELIAHFLDGVAAGKTESDLLRSFGNQKIAAKMIRRAKRRNRPLTWRAWLWSLRTLAVLLAVYAVVLLRFLIGQPKPTVDYIDVEAAATRAIPLADRAWPLWRRAIIGCTAVDLIGDRRLPESLGLSTDGSDWPAAAAWLRQHADDLAVARQAAAKPILGFAVGPGGSADDPQMFPPRRSAASNDRLESAPTYQAHAPYQQGLSDMAVVLTADMRLAAESGDGERVEADLLAVIGLAKQVRETINSNLIDNEVAVGVMHDAVDQLGSVLAERPSLLSDATLIRLAHALSGPQVAADLVDLRGTRRMFADIVQHVYTDDGHGDGRLTLAGFQQLCRLASGREPVADSETVGIAAAMIVIAASRAQVSAMFDQLLDKSAAEFAIPIRQVDSQADYDRWLEKSLPTRLRYAPVFYFYPNLFNVQTSAERYMGARDGVLVGIALEIYHRRHGQYPPTLTELTTDLLPAVPVDRITGDLVKYRLINGKPIVYSIGADRIDDGGQPPALQHVDAFSFRGEAAVWGPDMGEARKGDWVLYPPVGEWIADK